MGMCLSAFGILLVLVGAWFVAYEVVRKFRGETHGATVSFGGGAKVHKLGIFEAWEKKRNIAMWVGLGCITVGSILQLAGLFISCSVNC